MQSDVAGVGSPGSQAGMSAGDWQAVLRAQSMMLESEQAGVAMDEWVKEREGEREEEGQRENKRERGMESGGEREGESGGEREGEKEGGIGGESEGEREGVREAQPAHVGGTAGRFQQEYGEEEGETGEEEEEEEAQQMQQLDGVPAWQGAPHGYHIPAHMAHENMSASSEALSYPSSGTNMVPTNAHPTPYPTPVHPLAYAMPRSVSQYSSMTGGTTPMASHSGFYTPGEGATPHHYSYMAGTPGNFPMNVPPSMSNASFPASFILPRRASRRLGSLPALAAEGAMVPMSDADLVPADVADHDGDARSVVSVQPGRHNAMVLARGGGALVRAGPHAAGAPAPGGPTPGEVAPPPPPPPPPAQTVDLQQLSRLLNEMRTEGESITKLKQQNVLLQVRGHTGAPAAGEGSLSLARGLVRLPLA